MASANSWINRQASLMRSFREFDSSVFFYVIRSTTVNRINNEDWAYSLLVSQASAF